MDDTELEQFILADASFIDGGVAGLSIGSGDENPTLKFFDNLRRAALASFDLAGAQQLTSPSVFVLSDQPRPCAAAIDPSAKRLVDINLKIPSEWAGKLVFAAEHGTGGYWLPLPAGGVDEAIDLLDTHGFGSLPVAVVYPERRALTCYQEGGSSDSAPLRLDLPENVRPVTIQDIFEVVEEIRKKSLLTPQIGPPGFWADPSNYEPGPEAERTIQWVVAAQLRSSFRPLLVEPEQQIALGRVDLVITNPASGSNSVLHPAVIELKALKSRSHGGSPFANTKNIQAVVKGMRQTKAYREEKGAHVSVLCCFDLRQNKDSILEANVCVLARAKYFTDSRVDAFVFPIYGRTEDAQEAVAAALNGAA